jgi:hypothetical protein
MPMDRVAVLVAAFALVVLSRGCATGTSSETGMAGGGVAGATSSGGAAGQGGAGGSAPCADVVAGECLQGYAIGNVAPAGAAQGPVAQVALLEESDWYSVTFTPTGPATFGGGTPSIGFAVNTNDIYVFDLVPDCTGGSSPGCSQGGTAVGVTEWTFVDDQSTAGSTQWSTRNQPWPATVYVRVYRTSGSGCEDYQLSVTR